MSEKKNYLISDVARMVGLSQKRIRDYEKERLVKPLRDISTNNRIYVESDVIKIRRVKQLIHEYGFTLSCLKYILASTPCWIIYNCSEKDDCPAYTSFDTPCYEVMENVHSTPAKKCQTCSVFMNRRMKPFSLFEKPE